MYDPPLLWSFGLLSFGKLMDCSCFLPLEGTSTFCLVSELWYLQLVCLWDIQNYLVLFWLSFLFSLLRCFTTCRDITCFSFLFWGWSHWHPKPSRCTSLTTWKRTSERRWDMCGRKVPREPWGHRDRIWQTLISPCLLLLFCYSWWVSLKLWGEIFLLIDAHWSWNRLISGQCSVPICILNPSVPSPSSGCCLDFAALENQLGPFRNV